MGHNNAWQARKEQRAVVEKLATLPALARCSFSALHALAAAGTALRLPAHWSLIQETTPGTDSYLVLSGAVAVTRRGRLLAELRAGGLVGEVAPLEGRLRSATVTSVEEVHVLRFAFRDLHAVLTAYVDLADALLTGYRSRSLATTVLS